MHVAASGCRVDSQPDGGATVTAYAATSSENSRAWRLWTFGRQTRPAVAAAPSASPPPPPPSQSTSHRRRGSVKAAATPAKRRTSVPRSPRPSPQAGLAAATAAARIAVPKLEDCVGFPACTLSGQRSLGCAILQPSWNSPLSRLLAEVGTRPSRDEGAGADVIVQRQPGVCMLCLTECGLHVVGASYASEAASGAPVPSTVALAQPGVVGPRDAESPQPTPLPSPPPPPPPIASASLPASGSVTGATVTGSGTLAQRFLLPQRRPAERAGADETAVADDSGSVHSGAQHARSAPPLTAHQFADVRGCWASVCAVWC